ncbi:MAG: methionyl-tRNA formyltransferase [Bacteroidales bacterium]|nr:methionyl-tRNA formyltransferase [Bacteroidales bacterium]
MNKEEFRIVFMGTPEFAVPSLKALLDAGYPIAGVITAPDKPAGRGKQLRPSAVKQFALEHNLPVLQPPKLKNTEFLEELKALNAALQVVVAFRMLPEQVWAMPPYGTINLHASLLPHYRGAAPINHAIINGEKETGLTTFLLQKEIDTGNILFQTKLSIDPEENVGSLHDRMMTQGASLLLETVESLRKGETKAVDQSTLYISEEELKPAPKIFKEDCRIDWNKSSQDIFNLIRGLSPYPAAYSHLVSPEGLEYNLKVFAVAFGKENKGKEKPGQISTDGKTVVAIATSDGWMNLLEVQLAGKKRMTIQEFLRGFSLNNAWIFH